MKRVNVYLAEGFEEIEAVTIVDVLRRAGVNTITISITGKRTVTGAHGIIVTADEIFENADNMAADMIVLPGGMPGTMNLENHKGLRDVILDFAGKNKYIAAICAAPSVLGKLGLYDKKKAVCYPGFEKALKGAIVSNETVEQDGSFITSKGPGTAVYFALYLASLMKDKKEAEKLKKEMLIQG